MLDVHPPHAPTHTWRDFFIHIATIVVGLLIAVGLEQTVEAIHHHHQLETLRDQMHEVLQQNLEMDAEDFRLFAALRTRLIDLRSRIGSVAPSAPPSTGLAIFPRLPGIAPYEAAKENGTVALLSSSEIRIFNRLTHHVHILEMNGDSYRLKQSRPKRGS